jgi:Zn-finger nucleic acid-binding protein
MKCPACLNDLTEVQVGGVNVDVCQGGCGGTWFDAFELQRLEKLAISAGGSILNIVRDPAVQVDPGRKRECPRCSGIKLKRHFFSARRRVEVDHCPNCGGYWLDAGELAAICAEKAEAAAAAKAQGAAISIETIRHLYRLKTAQSPDQRL